MTDSKPRPAFLRAIPKRGAVATAPAALAAYPQLRLRRNRSDDWVRRMTAENRLSVDDLIWPIFLRENEAVPAEVHGLPALRRYTVEEASVAVAEARDLGIPAVALFPYVEQDQKTADCALAMQPDNLVCRAVRAVKASVPDIGLVCDVALDPYNSLGHDGLVEDGRVLNDETIELLCRQAVVQAEAGCDVIAPSDMMDGRIGAIRTALDAAGLLDTKICAYAAKYASAFYGPFRDAVGSKGALKGDKKTYQMDPANSDEALREVALDLDEGADMVMVKPGLPYLDIIHRVKTRFAVPTLAYQVSGEYAMIETAAQAGWLDRDKGMLESLLAFKRAGADAVLSYFARDIAELLTRR
jgi:porphobilinogen synthase